MSLFESAMETCVIMDKSRIADGYGGFSGEQWVEGAEFKAAISFNNSMESRIGEKQGVTSLYTVTTAVSAKLEYHDVFKRLRDGKIFRVTSDGDDKIPPKVASFSFSQVTAEEWVLPND